MQENRSNTIIVWLRRDLRLDDNPALRHGAELAAVTASTLLPVVVWPSSPGTAVSRDSAFASPGAASRWWLARSLEALERDLVRRGSGLLVVRGERRAAGGSATDAAALASAARSTAAQAVVWAQGIDPLQRDEDRHAASALRDAGIEMFMVEPSGLLFDADEIRRGDGGPYRVFTPFWNACRRRSPAAPAAAVATLPPAPPSVREGVFDAARSSAPPLPASLLPAVVYETAAPWADAFPDVWEPGEAGARARLSRLVSEILSGYADSRDRPDQPGTSRLSPHLHFGEISARRVWHEVTALVDRCEQESCPASDRAVRSPASDGAGTLRASAGAFLRQLAWRDFAHHTLDAAPHLPHAPLQTRFAAFPWRRDIDVLAAWQQGRTGYPLVDAGMRELWVTGWQHNRSRMVCASFLTKHLLLPWQEGEEWYWDTLVDADLANNAFGWQWVAGCGSDAAPYFRIFNPVAQGQRFDPSGDYVRRWVPELAALPARWIHRPWQAPAEVLEQAGVSLDRSYPGPIVDHAFARARALAAFAETKGR